MSRYIVEKILQNIEKHFDMEFYSQKTADYKLSWYVLIVGTE